MVAAVTMSVPGAKEPFAHIRSDSFKSVVSGLDRHPIELAALVGTDGKWSAMPDYSESLQARIATSESTVLSAQSFNPVNVSVAVTETQDANVLLQSVASALAEGQKDVVTAVGAALPSEAKRETADTAAVDEKNGYAEAAAAVLVSIEEEKVAALTRSQAEKAYNHATAGEAKAKAELALAAADAALKASRRQRSRRRAPQTRPRSEAAFAQRTTHLLARGRR